MSPQCSTIHVFLTGATPAQHLPACLTRRFLELPSTPKLPQVTAPCSLYLLSKQNLAGRGLFPATTPS